MKDKEKLKTVIVGSTVIKDFISRDLENINFFLIDSNNTNQLIKINLKLSVNLNPKYSDNRYISLGITDNFVFKKYSKIDNNNSMFKAIPELEIAFKMVRLEIKDVKDIEYIRLNHYNHVDWELVELFLTNRHKFINRLIFFIYRVILKIRL